MPAVIATSVPASARWAVDPIDDGRAGASGGEGGTIVTAHAEEPIDTGRVFVLVPTLDP